MFGCFVYVCNEDELFQKVQRVSRIEAPNRYAMKSIPLTIVVASAIATIGLGCIRLDSQSSYGAEDSVHAEGSLINPQDHCERGYVKKHYVFKDQDGNVEELALIKSNCLTPEQIAELKQFHVLDGAEKGVLGS